ncbi:MAG: bifunctional phosphopantothenoylcysteine decarboxylase/phosphopantothenate--cysteine ligase CoaBC [Chloroflexota bacterium]|jgi:phosphopantothenoylcysteine decarboxylase/phosphopantothenate--cysteine ligase|uniref:Flavoprotein domain-containing protein n=1 Tax=marine metagenome TaxID=408172 RepID=A0A381T3B0_9ZZZZ|nr:bifunctional phosphopantothenoylcysteine decarboxylase/phosphopantothenate--cysteine ligase CoaBC [Chloroflexota bacterium]|tara:strand:- start:24 stop:1220 length:1197 start_codon:yes stop_codon:yes gene_type:complete
MPSPLNNKRVVLGVTGSIACYKAADLASKLVQNGALVDVILTSAATQFVSELTFRSITHRSVFTDLYSSESELSINHVALAETADIIIVAPTTANTIAKIANGISDDVLTTTILATRAPIIIAPAMDANMFDNAATQANVTTLITRGVFIAGPANGRLASGLIGQGRMVEPSNIISSASMILGKDGDFSGKKIVVSAGGTEEAIDPVRNITNRSSGKMGYAIAEAARDRGAVVSLVAGPNAIPKPVGILVTNVQSAEEMKKVIETECDGADALIMAAAVADWRPLKKMDSKAKKSTSDTWSLELVKNPDIIGSIKNDSLIKVGFAAESENLIENSKTKVKSKNLDFIVANDITAKDSGFSVDTNKVTIIHANGNIESLPLMSKYDVGHSILDRVKSGF